MLEAACLSVERDERDLFHSLSFGIGEGEWVQVTGANGAGKTTLLRLLAGLLRPESGEIRFRGVSLAHAREQYYQNLLWIGHQPGMKARLTALENIRFWQPGHPLPAYYDALAKAGLAGYEDLPLHQLSAGQQRRASLARLWLTQAQIWLLDEPFTAIDSAGVARLTQRMMEHTAQGGIVIMTTHQLLPVEQERVRALSLMNEATA
ncbi:cytochrome c biogenesis heme-transporting ATPase CcmA [Enterobacteriaceae bacterium 89]|nr:cytochrome c biogenesis heme-transporting ATPase CcmA [Enterobacteriaceae bacterium 89]